jgi:hypothetical protein
METMFCIPPPDPFVTQFLSVTGPQGNPPAAPGCTQIIEATIQDDDGIQTVTAYYAQFDALGNPKYAWNYNMTYGGSTWTDYMIIIDSIPGDTFQWYIEVIDLLGNSVTTPGSYYYTETLTCLAVP